MKPSQIVTGIYDSIRFHTQGCKGNLDGGRGCYEIFQRASEFSGVKHGVMVWPFQRKGLFQVNILQAIAKHGNLDIC